VRYRYAARMVWAVVIAGVAMGAGAAVTPAQMQAIVQEGSGGTEVLHLRRIAVPRAGAGRLRVHVDRTFPLARAADAQEFNRAGHTEGKVILVVDPAHATLR
jgi:NADPH:quinone reductase-like Zn-dependent oxidoreductase